MFVTAKLNFLIRIISAPIKTQRSRLRWLLGGGIEDFRADKGPSLGQIRPLKHHWAKGFPKRSSKMWAFCLHRWLLPLINICIEGLGSATDNTVHTAAAADTADADSGTHAETDETV